MSVFIKHKNCGCAVGGIGTEDRPYEVYLCTKHEHGLLPLASNVVDAAVRYEQLPDDAASNRLLHAVCKYKENKPWLMNRLP